MFGKTGIGLGVGALVLAVAAWFLFHSLGLDDFWSSAAAWLVFIVIALALVIWYGRRHPES